MSEFPPPYKIDEVELIYRRSHGSYRRPQITGSIDAYQILIQHWDENKICFIEQAKLLLLDRANRVLGISDLSLGGVSGTVVDPKIVFVTALKANASSIILAHNHPSGNLKMSDADHRITQDIKEIGKKLTINLHDHILISSLGYYSWADCLEYLNQGHKNSPQLKLL